ncbi:MAG: CDC27 family protein [Minicystis sp.]
MHHRYTTCSILAVLLLSTPALAAGPDDPAKRQALSHTEAEKGLSLFAAGRWPEAYDQLRKADELYHSPPLTLHMARALVKMGRLIDARTLYEMVLEEPLSRSAPQTYTDAHTKARAELAALTPRIASLQVTVSGVPYASADVHLDGAVLPEGRREVDPGQHKLEARAPDGGRVARTITLGDGAQESISLALHSSPPPTQSPPRRDWRTSYVPTITAFGVGALGIVVGSITGGVSYAKVSDIRTRCDGNQCNPADRGSRDTAATLGNVSTGAFVFGAVGIAAGGALLGLRRYALIKRGDSATASWSFDVGPGHVGLQGSF